MSGTAPRSPAGGAPGLPGRRSPERPTGSAVCVGRCEGQRQPGDLEPQVRGRRVEAVASNFLVRREIAAVFVRVSD